MLEPGDALPDEPGLFFAVSPPAGVSSFAISGSSCSRTLRSSASGRHAPTRGSAAALSFADLRTGDYVVHEDRGVGRLLDSRRRWSPRSRATTCFSRSRVTTACTSRTSRSARSLATSAATDTGPLSRSSRTRRGSSSSHARARARELAGELIALYANRQRAEGIAYEVDGDLVEQLEASFAYEETPDQQRAIEAVKEDLESARPTDRLVCGDVGCGQTEIAVRAAFAVAVNGKQTLMLAPTTILAQQHWNTFRSGTATSPIAWRWSRASEKAGPDVKAVLRDFSEGKVEVMIGTHALSRATSSRRTWGS